MTQKANSFLDDLLKVANVLDESAGVEKQADEVRYEEPMNPDVAPAVSEDEVQRVLAETELEAEELAAAQLPEEVLSAEEEMVHEQLASSEEIGNALFEKTASEMYFLGSLAKIVEYSHADYISEEMQKEASNRLALMSESEEAFNEMINKTAEELFASKEATGELFSDEGYRFTMEQIDLLSGDYLEKSAEEGESAINKLKTMAGGAVEFAKSKVTEAYKSVADLKSIGAELEAVSAELEPERKRLIADSNSFSEAESTNFFSLEDKEKALRNQKRLGKTIKFGGGGALLAGGALYGGKKLYDHTHQEPQEQPEEEKIANVLIDNPANDTLWKESQIENYGGMTEMSNEFVHDFMKIAGAAGLIGIANSDQYEMELRKEASDAFEFISNQGRSEMGESFAKIAEQLYTEQELHEIVAGYHTEELFSKVAFFVEADDLSASELEKVANASGVAAKGVAGALRSAKDNIVATVDKAKDAAEGAKRSYGGAIKGEKGKGAQAGAVAGTGILGGGLIGAGAMAGYNVINNPSEYDIEQTAAAIEEAQLAKQAATEVYQKANAFLAQYGQAMNR